MVYYLAATNEEGVKALDELYKKAFVASLQCYQDAHVAFAAEKSRLEELEREKKRLEMEKLAAAEAARVEQELTIQRAKELEEQQAAKERGEPESLVVEKEEMVEKVVETPVDEVLEKVEDVVEKIEEKQVEKVVVVPNKDLMKRVTWSGKAGVIPYWLNDKEWEEKKLESEIFDKIKGEDVLKPSKAEWEEYFCWLEKVVDYPMAEVNLLRRQKIWQRNFNARLCMFLHFHRAGIPSSRIVKGAFGSTGTWSQQGREAWKGAAFVTVPIIDNSVDWWCSSEGVGLFLFFLLLIDFANLFIF